MNGEGPRGPAAGFGIEVLGRTKVFESLGREDLEALVAMGEEREAAEEELVYGVGDPADAFFVILEGGVVVFRDAVGHPVRLLARLEGGEWFGEMSLFGEDRRRSAARATGPTRLLRFGRDDLGGFLDGRPRVRLALQIAAAQRKSLDSAASLDVDRHAESRIAIHGSAVLSTPEGPLPVEILNLSLGGVSISDAPAEWLPGDRIRLRLEVGDHRLEREARIVWRTSHGLGLAFEASDGRRDHQLYALIHELTDG